MRLRLRLASEEQQQLLEGADEVRRVAAGVPGVVVHRQTEGRWRGTEPETTVGPWLGPFALPFAPPSAPRSRSPPSSPALRATPRHHRTERWPAGRLVG